MDFIVVIDIDGFVVVGVAVVAVCLAFYSFSSHNKFNRIGKVAWARSFDQIGWVNAVQDTLNKRGKIDKMGIGADACWLYARVWREDKRERERETHTQLSNIYSRLYGLHRTVFIYCTEHSACVCMNCKICNRILNSHTTSTFELLISIFNLDKNRI